MYNCTISGNSATEGGAIFLTGTQLNMLRSTLNGNFGGAIWNEAKGTVPSQAVVTACTLSGNTASAPGGAALRCDGGPNTFASAFSK